jgi:hypothetical protein
MAQPAFVPYAYSLPDSKSPNRSIPDAYRLVFGNIAVYYSFQHPVSFLNDKELTIRAEFWGRRRQGRKRHIDSIIYDAGIVCGDPRNMRMIPVIDFFTELSLVLSRDCVIVRPPEGKATGNGGKRRIKI